MKCPKCGFNSFEYLDNCKKCNSDLSAFKQSLGIQATILPTIRINAFPGTGTADEHAFTTATAGQEVSGWNSGAQPAFADEIVPAPITAEDELNFADSAAVAGSFATPPTDTFGEFSFDDLAAEPKAPIPVSPTSQDTATPPEPAASWTGSSEFSANDFPGFADDPAPLSTTPSLDDLLKQEEATPARQQTPPRDDLFNSDGLADLFKDDEPKK